MIFDNPFFTEMLLPFLLVFVVVFAILQKSKILGDGKAQIDAIVGLVVGLLLIGVPGPRDIVVGIMPWLSVGVAVLLVFLLLYGFIVGDLSKLGENKWIKIWTGILTGVFVIGIVLFVSGLWKNVWDSFGGSGDVWMNIIMIILVLAVMAVAVFGSKKE